MKVSIYYLIITIIISILLVIFIHNDIKRTQSVLLEGMATSDAITELIPVEFNNGNITLPNNLTVNKDTTLQGKLQVNKDTTIQGTLQVNNNTTIQRKLEVNNVVVNNDTTIQGNLNLPNKLLVDKNHTSVKKNLYVDGSTYLNNTFSGTTNIKGNLIVDGDIIFKGSGRLIRFDKEGSIEFVKGSQQSYKDSDRKRVTFHKNARINAYHYGKDSNNYWWWTDLQT